MARVGCESKGGFYFKAVLCPTVQKEAPCHQISSDSESLCKSSKKTCPKGSRKSVGTKTQQQMASCLGPKSAKPVPVIWYIQNGNS